MLDRVSLIKDCEDVLGLLNVELANSNLGALSRFRLEYCVESVERVQNALKDERGKECQNAR